MTTDTTVLDGLDFPTPAPRRRRRRRRPPVPRGAHRRRVHPDEVTDEQLAAVYDLVKWGPTALNTLPLRLLVVRTPEARERLAAHMSEGNRDRVLAAPGHARRSPPTPASTRTSRRSRRTAPRSPTSLEGQPEHARAMARTNALIQAGYLIVGLRAAGLAAGPMGGMDAAGIDAEFFADNGWKSLLVVNVGHVEGTGTHAPARRAPRATTRSSLTV